MEKVLPHQIYSESTPNPDTMKFVSNRWLITDGSSVEVLPQDRMNKISPLASALYQLPFVNGVFISANFVTITKNDQVDWNDISQQLRDFVAEFLNKGGVVVDTAIQQKVVEKKQEEEIVAKAKGDFTPLDQKIIDVLDEYIRPAVASDGGAIDYDSFNDGVVTVLLKGSCSGCPSSTITLKNGIEQLLTSMVPEVKEVVAKEV